MCTSLTGIPHEDLAGAPRFHDAIAALRQWMNDFDDALFCSWGDYDRKQFLQDCAFHQVAYPFHSGHLIIKGAFAQVLGLRKKLGIGDALRHLGLAFEGSPHRGLDDARNIARIVRRANLASLSGEPPA